jgi:hypothetical protein
MQITVEVNDRHRAYASFIAIYGQRVADKMLAGDMDDHHLLRTIADARLAALSARDAQRAVMDELIAASADEIDIPERPADGDMVERIVDAVIDAANIVSHDGYYEIDRDAATRAAIAAITGEGA